MLAAQGTDSFAASAALAPFLSEPAARRKTHCRIAAGSGRRTALGPIACGGTRDLTFTMPRTDGPICLFEAIADGRLLVSGTFSTIKGRSRNRFARLLPDGSLDESFAPFSSGWAEIGVNSVVIQHDARSEEHTSELQSQR